MISEQLAGVTELTSFFQAMASLLSALGGGATVRLIWLTIKKIRLRRSTSSFAVGFATCIALDHMRAILAGNRAMIFRAHNGGSDIRVSRPIYTSLHFQMPAPGEGAISWDKVPVSEDFWRILQEIERGDGLPRIIPTSSTQDYYPIGALLRTENISDMVVFKLWATSHEYWFAMVMRSDPQRDIEVTPFLANVVRESRGRLTRHVRDNKL